MMVRLEAELFELKVQFLADLPNCSPTKPTKPGFEGFVGSISGEFPNFSRTLETVLIDEA